MASTVQREATARHAATHNTVEYTVAATVQHGQLYGTWQHRPLAYKMASTIQHEATARHAATHNTVAYTVAATI